MPLWLVSKSHGYSVEDLLENFRYFSIFLVNYLSIYKLFQRLLPTEGAGDLNFSLPGKALNEKIYTVRSFIPVDEVPCFDVCRKYFNNLTEELNESSVLHDLIPDVNIGPFLTMSMEYSFVLVEAVSGKVAAYCMAAINAKQFYQKSANTYFPDIATKYPTEIVMKLEDQSIAPVVAEALASIHNFESPVLSEQIVTRYPSLMIIHYDKEMVENPIILRQLIAVCNATLKANGSVGTHVRLYSWKNGEDQEEQEAVISILGFQEIPGQGKRKSGSLPIFGKTL